MNETIKITEQELKQLIKEELGIHNDVNNLSDYIINYIKDKHYDIYTFTENQLPKLNKVKIDKIIVNYTNKENVSYFDIKKSQTTNQGAVLYFTIINGDIKEDVYHEMNHALQFFVLGKERSEKMIDYLIASDISKKVVKRNENIIDYFKDLMDRSKESEINATVAGTYSILKHKLGEKGFKRKMLKNDETMRNWFTINIKNTNGYGLSWKMINYNIFKDFNNRLKGIDEYEKIVYFTLFNKLISKQKENINKYLKSDRNVMLLTPDQVNSLMKKYQLFINKQGEKLKRKLFRLYNLFI